MEVQMERVIYEEDVQTILEAVNETLKRFKENEEELTASDVLIEKGYRIKALKIKDAENIVNIKRFLPRYFHLLKKEKKTDKQIKNIKKIINDFIEKYKTGRVY
jgi:hypothetical protein